MVAKRKTIPLHRLKEDTTDGFQIERILTENNGVDAAIGLGTHRDDHYIFLLQETGRSRCMVDFHSYTLKENTIFFILPGQVHRYDESDKATTGWFVAMDAGLIPERIRVILEDPLLVKRPLSVGVAEREILLQNLQLIDTVSQRSVAGDLKQAVHSLLSALVVLMADLYIRRPGIPSEKKPRPLAITQQFRKLLTLQYRKLKSPAEYAALLHISLSYLNEVVKDTTGFPVSYWIQQEIVLEAKRLLYHSETSVKEIAYELGYDDHTYFSRWFKKLTGQTPGMFRKRYRE